MNSINLYFIFNFVAINILSDICETLCISDFLAGARRRRRFLMVSGVVGHGPVYNDDERVPPARAEVSVSLTGGGGGYAGERS